MPENWVQRPVVNTEAGSNPGAPLAWGSPENPDDAVAGYGYVACDTSEVEETFYYHSDHLGSTSYITDQNANVTQYDAYLPYGELLVDEHSSSADLPYKFNGKELDEETGLYYYGARYMNPVTSMWYGVDPLAEKYVNIGAYIYCHNNPIKLYDVNGMQDEPTDFYYRDYGFGLDQIFHSAVNGLDQIEATIIQWFAPDRINANLIKKSMRPSEVQKLDGVSDADIAALYQVKFIDREPRAVLKQSICDDLMDIGFSIADVLSVIAPSKTTGIVCSKTTPISLQVITKSIKSLKSSIKQAQLPTSGRIRFVPKASDLKTGKLTRTKEGYVDKFDNIWTKGPSRTKGEAFEWDVQLSKRGKEK